MGAAERDDREPTPPGVRTRVSRAGPRKYYPAITRRAPRSTPRGPLYSAWERLPGPLLIEEMGEDLLAEIVRESARQEAAKRLPPYDVFKWWGRRYATLSRAVLAGLVTGVGEEELLLASVRGPPPRAVRKRARGLLVVDPFAGGGTIPIEAGALGFSALGIDVLPSAVHVARATLEIAGPGCRERIACLLGSLIVAWRATRHLWESPMGTVIHVFHARCESTECMVPALLTVRGRGVSRRCLLISAGGTRWASGGDCEGIGPTRPLIRAPAGMLPRVAPGSRAYAVEIYGPGGERFFVPFTSPEWVQVAAWLERTARLAGKHVSGSCTPVGGNGEEARLRGGGVECWEHIYTPRQLASLEAFVRAAERLGCARLARTAVASASRSTSLLAIYYQPAARVNPALVIKGYWIPRYPVELNPLAHRPSRTGPPLPLGRGGLASIIRRAWRACRERRIAGGATVGFRQGDATDPSSYPERLDHIVTDPPYPGMQDYSSLARLYGYWLGSPRPPRAGRDRTDAILGMLRAARDRIRPGGYVVLIIGAGLNHFDRLLTTLRALTELYGLRRVYWLPGEPPGGLGRSRVRGVYLVVAARGAPHRPDALEPLEWTRSLARKFPGLDPLLEEERSRRLAEAARQVISAAAP